MSKTFKAKSILIAVFTMVMALSLVLGLGLNNVKVKADGETEPATTTQWMTSRSTPLQELQGSGIQYQEISATIMNNTNILDVPGRTVRFQFRMNDVTDPWQGMMFLNGQEEWKAANWPGINRGCDTLPHIIINPLGSAQIFGNTTDSIYGGAVGVDKMTALTDSLHTVEIHIGDGNTDKSYMKINGVELLQQNTDVSAIKWATVDKFDKGCYFAVTYNANPNCIVMLGEYNTPYTEDVSDGFKYVDLSKGEAPDGLTFTAKNIVGDAKLYVNGTEVTNETTYTVTDVEDGKKYVLNQSFWTVYQSVLKKSSAIYVEAENGKGAVVMTVQLAAPPVWAGESYKEINEGDTLSYSFTYTGAPQTADSLVVKTGVRVATTAIEPETDYTLEKNGTAYTLTFTPAYLNKAFAKYRSFAFSITIGEDSLEGSVYCIPEATGWYARSVDIAKGKFNTEGNYVSGTFARFSSDTLASRLIYNQALDVTKPITLEVAKLDSNFTWALIGIMDSRKTLDYFSNETANDSKLMALVFGKDRSDIQRLAGFKAETSTNADYTNTAWTNKNIVVEMYFGTTQAESYFRINGSNCGTPTATQADFADGKAYLGFFFNNQVGSFEFIANKNVNGIAVTGPNTEASYKVDLAKAQDLVLDVIGTTGENIEVTNAKGVKATADQIAYANGQLTIKAAYFAGLDFAKTDVLTIADTATQTATEINMVYSTSNMAGTMVAFATKGDVKDAVFTLPEGITGVSYVYKNDVALTAANYAVKDGKLTLDKSQIDDKESINEFIVISGNKVIMAYVYVAEFENGYVKGGQGTVEAGKGAYVMTSASKVTLEKVIDLKAGLIMKIDFKAIADYYKNTANYQNPTYITFNFYDPNRGLTLVYTLYANYNEEEANATDTALYEQYKLVAADGTTVSGISGVRALSLVDSDNSKALGVHIVKFEAAGEGLKITVDDQRATTIASLGNFTLGANILTIESSASVGEKESKVAFKQYGVDEQVDYESITVEKDEPIIVPDSGDSSKTDNTTGGSCSSCKSVVSTSGVLGVLSLVAYAVIRRKKH